MERMKRNAEEWPDTMLQPDDFVWFGRYLLGPHPVSWNAHCWLYHRGSPPRAFTQEEEDRAERLIADIFNRDIP